MEVHLFFSAAPRKAARAGFEWGGGKAGKHSDSDTQAAIKRESLDENVKKREKDSGGAMAEVKGSLHLSCIPQINTFPPASSYRTRFSSSASSVCILL